jgi:uncharacterized protein (DUF2147 family)
MNRHQLLTVVLVATWGIFSFNLSTAQSVQTNTKNDAKPVTVTPAKKSATPATPATPAKQVTVTTQKKGATPATPATPAKQGVKQGTPTATGTTANKDIKGYWLSAQKATIVEFYPSGNKFNGKAVWSRQKDKNGKPLKDVNNPDKSKRSRSLEGIDLITGLTYNPKTDTYEGGKIYQPNTGKTFNCKVKLDNSKNTMQITGGVGFISKTLTWTRTTGIPGK